MADNVRRIYWLFECQNCLAVYEQAGPEIAAEVSCNVRLPEAAIPIHECNAINYSTGRTYGLGRQVGYRLEPRSKQDERPRTN